MKLERQVSGLASSQRLKELGVKQESAFYYHYLRGLRAPIVYEDNSWTLRMKRTRGYRLTSAFTVAELGEMLYVRGFSLTEHPNGIEGFTVFANKDEIGYREYGHTEADARAKMLIYLLENKLISV